ncbi:MAG: hypothetical protein AB4426_08490 [Xenococcaceae cyanobacterium]
MAKLKLSEVTLADLRRFINLQEEGVEAYEWTQVDLASLSETEQQRLQYLKSDLLNYQIHLMNEATIWSRAIYPLLLLAEQKPIQAWAGVTLQAQYAKFEIEVIADGILGKATAGFVESPYLVVVEAKRGVEGDNPLFQLYGQILAAAHLNWSKDGHQPQEIFGCYTIADSWTFLRAEVEGIEAEKPKIQVEYSREYVEKIEAETILKILKGIVSKYVDN